MMLSLSSGRSGVTYVTCFSRPVEGGRSPLLRTPLPRSDTASRISFEDFPNRATFLTTDKGRGHERAERMKSQLQPACPDRL
jgi:hypothetical protein